MDLEATYHATPMKDVFVTYHNGDFSAAKMENKDVSQIVGIGDVHYVTKISWPIVLKHVRHVADLLLNLVSAVELDDAGYNINLDSEKSKLSRGSLIVV